MTPTGISNLALDAVPAGHIVSMSENSLAARSCREHYPQVLGELLELGPWRWGLKRGALAELPANDRPGVWLYVFAIPIDMAFPVRLLDQTGSCDVAYEFSGVYIYTNAPNVVAEYVTTADVASSHSALFRAALIATLAARICMPITKDIKRATALQTLAVNATERAQAANHNQQNQGYDYFENNVPAILRERLGLQLDRRTLTGPEANYPDFDPVQTFEDNLDT